MSASRPQLLWRFSIPPVTASNAWCGRRPGRAPYREPEKLFLVDSVEHLDCRPLDDFVFQRRRADGSLATISFRNVDTRDRWGLDAPRFRRSDNSLRPCGMVVSLRFTMRALLRWARPDAGPPESRTRCFRACQGSSTPPGACTPCHDGVPAVAFRVLGARRHPDWPFQGSIPCLHIPLSTLHGPRYRGSRLTRGQRGWLDLYGRRLALLHIVPVCLGTP